MCRLHSVPAVLLLMLVGFSVARAQPAPVCSPLFDVVSTGPRTSFQQEFLFEEGQPWFCGLQYGRVFAEPVQVEVTVTRFIPEQRVKTVRFWRRQYEVTYTVYVPVQELATIDVPTVQGWWIGFDPCRFTRWVMAGKANGALVSGGGVTVGDELYGKIKYHHVALGFDGVYKLEGLRQQLPACP